MVVAKTVMPETSWTVTDFTNWLRPHLVVGSEDAAVLGWVAAAPELIGVYRGRKGGVGLGEDANWAGVAEASASTAMVVAQPVALHTSSPMFDDAIWVHDHVVVGLQDATVRMWGAPAANFIGGNG
ncbi:unnamed protein product [Laminaria digitata]